MEIIPLIDLREATPGALLEEHDAKALSLIDAARRIFGHVSYTASHLALPLGDWLVKRWLSKTNNPYREEIARYARHLNKPGVWALNLVYEFGCTSGVYATKEGPRLLRVLDWPFEGLGRHMVVTRQRGPAGDFHNVTWPGLSGVYTAMCEGRFSVALNQAPMRRFRMNILFDWMRNRLLVWNQDALPPAHLLRQACERAGSYEEAKRMLSEVPVSIPVIFVLAGTKDGQGCVIERLEKLAVVRELGYGPSVSAANHFLSHINGIGYGWRPREIDSCGRAVCAGGITPREAMDPNLSWFKPPIANINSRLCFSANAMTGSMSLLGTQGEASVTELLTI